MRGHELLQPVSSRLLSSVGLLPLRRQPNRAAEGLNRPPHRIPLDGGLHSLSLRKRPEPKRRDLLKNDAMLLAYCFLLIILLNKDELSSLQSFLLPQPPIRSPEQLARLSIQ